MYNFTLDNDAQVKLREWISNRGHMCTGAIGGRYTFSFTPTSLGVIIKVTDGVTKDEIDLTAYEEW